MGTSNPNTDAAPAAADAMTSLPAPPVQLTRPALFLDLDGVLAPLAATPDAVVPNARRTRVLQDVAQRLDGRVAIVSGRTIAEIFAAVRLRKEMTPAERTEFEQVAGTLLTDLGYETLNTPAPRAEPTPKEELA